MTSEENSKRAYVKIWLRLTPERRILWRLQYEHIGIFSDLWKRELAWLNEVIRILDEN